jgi:hypothetical protein
MVTKKEQNDLLIGPKAAIVLGILMVVIGLLAWGLTFGRHDQNVAAYDLTNPGKTVEESPSSRTQFPFGAQAAQDKAPAQKSVNK